ncbi:ABC transporter permease [Halonotius terrestris]|uniref:ABC transporter permease n=1 Tax=Halonotius terrestris TaxID=2487750 RepID=A0A8J8P930_9EURY|nr:ABC transporter permease [Halonotius terrestris]TQQ79994.1 ABC transporter permease [Halonotius terrestris]
MDEPAWLQESRHRLADAISDQRATIAKRELWVLGREKTIILALVIQLFIAGFSGFLVVGLVSLYDPGSVEGYQIDAAVTGDASDEMLAAMDQRAAVSGSEYSTTADAFEDFQAGTVDAVFEANQREGRIEVVMTAPEGSIETTLIVSESQETLRTLERQVRTQRADDLVNPPLALPPDTGGNPYYDFTYTILLPLLVFLPVFISGSITVDSLTEEAEQGTLELLRVAPVTMVDIVDGKAAAMIAIAPLQAMLWLALLAVNGVAVANAGWLFALVTAVTTIVVALSVATALLAPDRRSAQLLFSVGILLFFGGATLLPGGPANTAARLAIDSATGSTRLAVAVYGIVAVAAAVAVRRLAMRIDPNTL